MKILVVSHSYPRWDGDVAGAFIHRLNLGLAGRGHAVRVVVPADRGSRGDYELDGVVVSRVGYSSPSRETLAYAGNMAHAMRSPRGILSLQSLVRHQAAAIRNAAGSGFDLVHAHWWVPGGLSAWLARANIPYVLTSHGTDVAVLERSAAGRMVARRVFARAAAISVVSHYLAERLGRLLRIDSAAITVQPMPVDVERFGSREEGGRGVVTVGRLTEQKRVETILRAYRLLRDRGYPGPLRVIGDGPDRGRLEAIARDLELPDGVFVGEVPPEAIPDLVGGSDVFVFAAVAEGLGLVAAEALMLGTPVAAVRSGGVTDLVPDGGAGRLVPPDDPDALARAMAEMLHDSAASRQSAREAGNQLKHGLSRATAAETIEGMYRRVLSR